jgi:hypothetical protein
MTIATLIARFFSIGLLVIGVSHLAQPKLWRDFFVTIKRSGFAGIIIAMFTLPQGLLIVLGHNVWVADIRLIITLCGWGMTIKSITYLIFPGRADAVIPEGENTHRNYAWAGAGMIPISLALIWHSFFRAP